MNKSKKAWLAALSVALVALIAMAACGIFSPKFINRLPDETANMRTLPDYELDRILRESPESVTRITCFKGLRKVVADVDPLGPALVDYPNTTKLLTEAKAGKVLCEINDVSIGRIDHVVKSLHWSFWALFAAFGGGIAAILWYSGAFKKLEIGFPGNDSVRPVSEGGSAEASERRTFDDVAGCDEAIAKLRRVARWLKTPGLYEDFGAKIPRGILAVGPPGTGKTLLARALAGEVDANFFSVSGSHFVEMFVGVGAKRVRKLFQAAISEHERTGKPSIIFIDEIDAIGKKRGQGHSGADSEREQTLNQLLVCMQGFEQQKGIIVMGATNMVDSLDEALKRPGRFDYQVSVDLPDTEGREKIFSIHTRNMKLAANVRLRDLAVRTPQFSGADIEQACNEAAIAAADRLELRLAGATKAEIDAAEKTIALEDFDIGIDYVQFGDPLLSRAKSMSQHDKRNTAFHEAGHCAVQQALQGYGADPITKVTIEPRTKSLGSMQSHSDGDRYCYNEDQLRARIMAAMGGRLAQEYFLNTKDTGAQNDFEQATRLARLMVSDFGMSKLGPLHVRQDAHGTNIGAKLADEMDDEYRRIVQECYDRARELIVQNERRIERIAEALLADQTILAERFQDLWFDGEPRPASAITLDDDGNKISVDTPIIVDTCSPVQDIIIDPAMNSSPAGEV
jgi:cell division protease FtsH